MKSVSKSIIITPEIGFPIVGNVRVDNISRGIHDDLLCNLIILDDEKGNIVCFAGFDLCIIERSECLRIKETISENTGIPQGNIIVTATHTHSGPDVTKFTREELLPEAVDYFDKLIENIAETTKKMMNDFEKVIIKVGKNKVNDLSFNRRLVLKDSTVKMNFEEFNIDDVVKTTGPIDPELLVMSIWDVSDKLKSLVVNFTLHAAILVGHKWLISRDYINDMDDTIKEKYGRDVVVYFANGAEGNINHINYKDPTQGRGFEETHRIGTKLGSYVIDTVKKSNLNINDSIYIKSYSIKLPMRKLTKEDIEWSEMVIERDKDIVQDLLDGIPDLTYAKEYAIMQKQYKPFLETEVIVLKMGDILMVTLPGEIFVEYGLAIKYKSDYTNTFILGLANDNIGYVPDMKAFNEGGYEVKTACSSQLAVEAGDIMLAKILEFL